MMKTPIVASICWLILLGLGQFAVAQQKIAADLSGTIHLSPDHPQEDWPRDGAYNQLAPKYTATITITVDSSGTVNGKNYTLSKGPNYETGDDREQHAIWSSSGSSFWITNTATDRADVSVSATCEWKAVSSGSGSGGSADTIGGSGNASIKILDSVVSWDADHNQIQWADGQHLINWTATFTDDNNYAIERCTAKGFDVAEAAPQGSGTSWAIVSGSMQSNILRGTVKSGTASSGKIRITYDDGSEEKRISDKKLTFIKLLLKDVTFSAGRRVNSDNIKALVPYDAPQWQDPKSDGSLVGGHSYPICYNCGTNLQAEATWVLQPADAQLPSILIKATGTSGIDIKEASGSVTAGEVKIAPTQSTNTFTKVDFIDRMNLDWTATIDNKAEWVDVGASKNRCMVTLGGDEDVLYTLAYIGCAYGKGAENPDALVQNCFLNGFAGRNLYTVKDDLLKLSPSLLQYYGSWAVSDASKTDDPNCFDMAALLIKHDGRCEAWANFFAEVLVTQGLSAKSIALGPVDNSSLSYTDKSLMVKEWDLTVRPGKMGVGIPGQGNPDPPEKNFKSHAVVPWKGRIYDPSYGIDEDSPQAWERRAVHAVGYWNKDANGNLDWANSNFVLEADLKPGESLLQ